MQTELLPGKPAEAFFVYLHIRPALTDTPKSGMIALV